MYTTQHMVFLETPWYSSTTAHSWRKHDTASYQVISDTNWKLTFIVCATRFSTFLDHSWPYVSTRHSYPKVFVHVIVTYTFNFLILKISFFISAYCTTIFKHNHLDFTHVDRENQRHHLQYFWETLIFLWRPPIVPAKIAISQFEFH